MFRATFLTAILGFTSGVASAKPNGWIQDRWQGGVRCDGKTESVWSTSFEQCEDKLEELVEDYESLPDGYDCDDLSIQECEIVSYTWKDAAGGVHISPQLNTAGATVVRAPDSLLGAGLVSPRVGVVGHDGATTLGGHAPLGSDLTLNTADATLQPFFDSECEELRWKAEQRCGEGYVDARESCEPIFVCGTGGGGGVSASCEESIEALEESCWDPCPLRGMDEISLPVGTFELQVSPASGGGGLHLRDWDEHRAE